MTKMWFWINIWMLITIHTIDMYLTEHYIHNDWQREIFPPMSYCIREFGIYEAIWISRFYFYLAILLAVLFKEKQGVKELTFVANIFYYTSMIIWLFFFRILVWPIVE